MMETGFFVHASPLMWVNNKSIGSPPFLTSTPKNVVYPIIYAHYKGDIAATITGDDTADTDKGDYTCRTCIGRIHWIRSACSTCSKTRTTT